MIHIFFVPGMFGSMLEYVLRSKTVEGTPITAEIKADGSMHSFIKKFHPRSMEQIITGLKSAVDITTPIYPCPDAHLPEIISKFKEILPDWEDDAKIILHAPDIRWAEINLLFLYHKVSIGLGLGMEIVAGDNQQNIARWNPSYTHWTQMHRWEFREWISLFYDGWVQEWINIDQQSTRGFLRITNRDVIENPHETITGAIRHCGCTPRKDLNDFLMDYVAKQDYVLKEYHHIEKAVESTVEGIDYIWPELSIIGEAIIQRKLRSLGFELQCDGLDVFPTSSVQLKKITYRPDNNLHQS